MQVGTTVAVCLFLLRPGSQGSAHDLYVANAGDTRVVLISQDGPTRLSVDHVASDLEEVRRVHDAGGRVVNKRVGGSLAVTRALGDHSLKGNVNGGVTSEPHCATHLCSPLDCFLVIASDGVWDVLTDEDANQLVMQAAHMCPDEIAEKLVQAALAGMSRDNISALVIRLR